MAFPAEDLRLAQHLLARGIVPEAVLRECAREGDAHESRGLPRPRLAAQLAARGALSPADQPRLAADPPPPRPPTGRFGPPAAPRPSGRLTKATTASGRLSPQPELPQVGGSVGPFVLEAELGKGAMGSVFRARHERTGATAALKVIPRRAQIAERFEREVQAFAKLRHPNVVAIHETGEAPGYLWYAMDLVDGSPLDELVQERKLERDALVRIVLQVARGMEHAHQRGVIHRDLKPSNILVTPDRVARVTDFGAARILDRATHLTREGTTIGTPYYMSPEQAVGEVSQIDERSDVWALGVMLYEVTTGTLPFHAETPLELVARICDRDPERPRARAPGLSRDLEAVILRALAKKKNERYRDAGAFADDLERYLRGDSVSASRVTFTGTLLRTARRQPLSVLAPAVLAVAIGAGLVALGRRGDERPPPSDPAVAQALDAEREAGAALERIQSGKASPGEALALATTALARLEAVSRGGTPEARKLTAWPTRIELVVLRARALVAEGDAAAARAALEGTSENPGSTGADVAVALGDTCLVLGDSAAAVAAFERALRLAPERWDAVLGRIRARTSLSDAGPLAPLEADLAKVERVAPPALVLAARADLARARGKSADARALLANATRLDANLALARIARARLLRDAGDFAGAVNELRLAARDPQAGRLEAAWDEELGALPDAASALARVVALVPEDARAQGELATLRAALGDLDAAAGGLLHEAIPAEEALGAAGRAALEGLARVLAPIELARSGASEALAQRLEGLGDRCDAALVRAELASDEPRRRALEAAVEAAHDPEDRARLEAELARLHMHANDLAGARVLAERAVSHAPASPRALEVRAALLARAGDIDAARTVRAAAEAARPRAYTLALEEARGDALVICDGAGRGIVERRIEDARRLPQRRLDPKFLAPPSRELTARATRELEYAARLDPGASEPIALLARLLVVADAYERQADPLVADPLGPGAALVRPWVETLGDGPSSAERRASSLALDALEADPLDPVAATAALILAPIDAATDARILALTKAARGTQPDDVRLLLAATRRGYALNAGRPRIQKAIFDLARARPHDRVTLAFATQFLRLAVDPRSNDLEVLLAKSDHDVDEARGIAARATKEARLDFATGRDALRRALEVAPEDAEVVRSAIDVYRDWVRTNVHSDEWSKEPELLMGRLLLLSGDETGELVRWTDGVRPFIGPEDVAAYRAEAERAAPGERPDALAAICLLEAGDPFTDDPRKLGVEGKVELVPASACLPRVAALVARVPGSPLARGLRAIQLARAGRVASAKRELERLVERRTPTFNDRWLAAGALVLGGDHEGAARQALLALTNPGTHDVDKRDFVNYPPFLGEVGRTEWAPVVEKSR